MYRANYKVNHSITFGDTAYLLSPRPDPMDLGTYPYNFITIIFLF